MRLYWPVVGEGVLVGRECQEEEPSPTLGNSSSEAGSSPRSRWLLLSFPSFWTRLNCETQALVLRSAPEGIFFRAGVRKNGTAHCQKHFRQEMKSFVGGLNIQWELIYVGILFQGSRS